MSDIMSGHTIRIDKRDVPYSGPYIRAEGREIPVSTSGRPVTLPTAAPIAKRDAGAGSARNVRKLGVPATFGQVMAAETLGEWLPGALVTLGAVIDAAIAGDPNDPTITPELRLEAVRGSLASFGEQLLERIAAAIVGQAPAVVAKRKPSTWKGML
jgi:hypothetical protein